MRTEYAQSVSQSASQLTNQPTNQPATSIKSTFQNDIVAGDKTKHLFSLNLCGWSEIR